MSFFQQKPNYFYFHDTPPRWKRPDALPDLATYVLDTKVTRYTYEMSYGANRSEFPLNPECGPYKKVIWFGSTEIDDEYDPLYSPQQQEADRIKQVYEQMDELFLTPGERREVREAFRGVFARDLPALAVYSLEKNEVRMTCPVSKSGTVCAGERIVALGNVRMEGNWSWSWTPAVAEDYWAREVYKQMDELSLNDGERAAVRNAYKEAFGKDLPAQEAHAAAPAVKPSGPRR